MSAPPGTYGYLFWAVAGRLYGESPPVWEVDRSTEMAITGDPPYGFNWGNFTVAPWGYPWFYQQPYPRAERCPVCHGTGEVDAHTGPGETKTCHGCGGKGWVQVG